MKSTGFPAVYTRPEAGTSRWYFFFLAFFLLLLGAVLRVNALDDSPRGDAAVAERYAQWAKEAIERGQWGEALAGLERASDFANVSSDISYLLALARSHENKGRGLVLEALERSLVVNCWNLYRPEAARLLKAENLIDLRAYSQALGELSLVGKGPDEAVLTLKALAALQGDDFHRYMTETLDRYPRESDPVRFFLSYLKNEVMAGRNLEKDDQELLELVIRRLPVLLLKDQELAWMAAPFMRDRDEAKRLVSAYRAVNKPVPASLPIALKLGIIDGETALEELFAARGALDMALLAETWELLDQDETKAVFRRNLSVYSGVITEDADRDGIPESSAEYSGGLLGFYTYDADQDGVPDLTGYFEAGDPLGAQVLIPPDGARGAGLPAEAGRAAVQWERYPAVLEVKLDGVRYIPRPLDFYFSPFTFVELWGSGVLFPRKDILSPPLTRRVLVSQSLKVERPSLEFKGGIEVVELNQGIPVRAREYVGDLMVSETEFLRGRPQIQRVDLDFDGRMETVRHFRHSYRPVELERLWDYDRDIDYTVTVGMDDEL